MVQKLVWSKFPSQNFTQNRQIHISIRNQNIDTFICTSYKKIESPLTREERIHVNQIAHYNGFGRLLNQAVFLSWLVLLKVLTMCLLRFIAKRMQGLKLPQYYSAEAVIVMFSMRFNPSRFRFLCKRKVWIHALKNVDILVKSYFQLFSLHRSCFKCNFEKKYFIMLKFAPCQRINSVQIEK